MTRRSPQHHDNWANRKYDVRNKRTSFAVVPVYNNNLVSFVFFIQFRFFFLKILCVWCVCVMLFRREMPGGRGGKKEAETRKENKPDCVLQSSIIVK